jgi:hypothetical protein
MQHSLLNYLKDKSTDDLLKELKVFSVKLGYSEVFVDNDTNLISYTKSNGHFHPIKVQIHFTTYNENVTLHFNFPNKNKLGFSAKKFSNRAFNEIVDGLKIDDLNDFSKISEIKNTSKKSEKKNIILVFLISVLVPSILFFVFTFTSKKTMNEYRGELINKNRAEVKSIMGKPDNILSYGGKEIWTYYNKVKDSSSGLTCDLNLNMELYAYDEYLVSFIDKSSCN